MCVVRGVTFESCHFHQAKFADRLKDVFRLVVSIGRESKTLQNMDFFSFQYLIFLVADNTLSFV